MSTNKFTIENSFSERLRKLIDFRLGGKQKAFSELTGISASYLSMVLSGQRGPSADLIAALSVHFSEDIRWAVTGEGEIGEGKSLRALDQDLLRLVIEAVEQALDDLDLELKPAKKAELVVTLYEMYREDKKVDRATLIRLVKLAA